MKRIFLLLFSLAFSLSLFAQTTDATMTTRSEQIRDETAPKANTANRVGTLFKNLTDSKVNIIYGVTASGTDTYTASVNATVTSYITGQHFLVLFTNANTGAATLNINSIGDKSITKNGSTALSSGDIPAGSYQLLAYDGTNLQLVGTMSSGGTTYTFSDGITETGGAAKIGGTLTEDRAIDLQTFNLSLGGIPSAATDPIFNLNRSVSTNAIATTIRHRATNIAAAGASGLGLREEYLLETTADTYTSSGDFSYSWAASTSNGIFSQRIRGNGSLVERIKIEGTTGGAISTFGDFSGTNYLRFHDNAGGGNKSIVASTGLIDLTATNQLRINPTGSGAVEIKGSPLTIDGLTGTATITGADVMIKTLLQVTGTDVILYISRTDCSGADSGALWIDGDALKICP